jgi:hypothetical protein
LLRTELTEFSQLKISRLDFVIAQAQVLKVAQLQISMKKPLLTIFIFFAAIGLFLGGWYFGRQSGAKLASDIMQMQEYNNEYSQIADNEVVLDEIDSGRTEDAKHMIYLTLGGNVFALENLLTFTNSSATFAEMKALLDYNNSIQSPYGSERQRADRIFARVAWNRTNHPWIYKSSSSNSTDAEIEAQLDATKLDAILKQASQRAAQNQK